MKYGPALALVACLAAGGIALPARQAREPHDFLRRAGVSDADLAALDRGQPVARVLDTERREVAVVGAVRIGAPRERMIARYREVGNLKRTGIVLDLGVFSDPPTEADVQALQFEEYDLESVRECVPGDCPVRLSDEGMARFRAVDWEQPDWAGRTASIWRELLTGLVTSYRQRGDSALPEYHNKEEPLRVRDEFAILYARSADVGRLSPEAYRYIREFPRAPLEGVTNLFYWSKEDFGLKPVTSITHLMLYDPPGAKPAVAAAKQIYATHYFDAGLGFTLAIDDAAGGFYMVSVNRARTRSLMSPFRAVVRRIVRNRSRDAMEKVLTTMKTSLEGTGSAGRE